MAAEPQPLYFRTLDSQPWERGDREAAAEWQQARMLHAITRAVAEKGYAKVTVADVVGLAGVSRRTFYEHFDDVEDCFVAAYETATTELLGEVGTAVRAATTTDWRVRFEVAIVAYVEGLASDPHMARACLVDVQGAGPRAVETRRLVYERFVAQMRALRHGRRDGKGEIPQIQVQAAVGAIGELVQEQIFDKGAESLPEIIPTLVRIGWALLESPFELTNR
jgi:AcrR family transcriptional regulator